MHSMSNSDMAMKIVNAGMQSILVDGGRYRMQGQGFCASGALDNVAFTLANRLLSQHDCTPAIECLGATEFAALTACSVAVTGPDISVEVNAQQVAPWQTLTLRKGDTLAVSPTRLGTRYYLAIAGTWQVTPVAGSVSTSVRERLGGTQGDGTPLRAGQLLPVAAHDIDNIPPQKLVTTINYSLATPLAVIPGYQWEDFSAVNRALFFSSAYTVSPQIDRMGYRLKGPAVNATTQALRSEAINMGAIQVPADGQPIIMLNDRQTLGGYPKLGCVALADIYRLVQAVPGDTLTFYQTDMATARTQWLLMQRRLQHIMTTTR